MVILGRPSQPHKEVDLFLCLPSRVRLGLLGIDFFIICSVFLVQFRIPNFAGTYHHKYPHLLLGRLKVENFETVECELTVHP